MALNKTEPSALRPRIAYFGVSEMEAELHISSVPQPINTTVACGSLNVEDLKCIVKSRNKIKSFQPDIVELSKSLEVESKLLDTFLYKNHNRFRNDKGYRTAKMLDKTLKKMLDLSFTEKLLDFLEFVPSHWGGQHSVRLPTRAMSNYRQLLLVIAGKFLQKIDRLARKCGLLNMQRLNLGHFWGVAALCLAIVSRVWVLCKNLLCQLELCYSNLEKINPLLPGVPLDYDLPQHLYQLLDEELKTFVKNSEAISSPPDDFSAAPGVNVEEFLDLGEPVKRKSDIDFHNQELSHVKKLKVDTEIPKDKEAAVGRAEKIDRLTDIHSIEEFKKFLSEESDLRKTSKKDSFTRKLSQEQWKALKKEILSSLNPVIPNKSIKLCRKLIRKSLKD